MENTSPTRTPESSPIPPPSAAPGSPSSARGPRSSVLGPPSSVLGSRFSVLGPLALFSVLWLDLIRQLSYEWSANEQYAYGYFVPILALGLFLKKWPNRPPFSVLGLRSSVPRPPSSVLGLAVIIALCLLLLPLRVILEINQDWPLLTWSYSLIVVALTLHALHLAGGPISVPSSPFSVLGPRSSVPGGPTSDLRALASRLRFQLSTFSFSHWVTHFAFAVCFILVALRWPSFIELPVIKGLTRSATSLTVETLGWFDIPALQHGNVIELANGSVGVDEACSGIRSFQSTLMGALFLGELYLLSLPGRLLLLVVGLPMAFLLNVVRTTFLSVQASSSGTTGVAQWHDSAGTMIFLVTFACLWVLALLLRRRFSAFSAPPSSVLCPPSSVPPPTSDFRHSTSGLPLSAHQPFFRFLLAVGCWAIFMLAFTQIWYRPKDKEKQPVHWTVSMPEKEYAFKKIDIPPRTWELLNCDSGTAGTWQQDGGVQWDVYFFRWQGKTRRSLMAARGHEPGVCIGGKGLELVNDVSIGYFVAGGLTLPFRRYTFEGNGTLLHVLFCIWQDGDESRKGMRWISRRDRLVMVGEGRRTSGQQTLEIITRGYSSLEEAEQAVRRRLPGIVQLQAQKV